ncbi:hypothetical protein ABT214_00570 [Micromonospora purpureochromogenes]|uniref:hypothetical protein n=1 Tax=Micromonospora purpureochromogenes TaxID=47872 RepID=UPI003317993D
MPETFELDRVDRITDILYGVAVAEGLICYGPLGKRVGVLPHYLGPHLDKVSERAADRGEPIWSALVVGKETRRPHEGFYDLARRMRPEYVGLDNEVLWEKERERCYAAAR